MSRRDSITLPDAFYDAELITGVLKVVQSGKEATVYCCRAHPSTGEEYIENVCRYFAPYGIHADPSRLTRKLWSRFLRAEL